MSAPNSDKKNGTKLGLSSLYNLLFSREKGRAPVTSARPLLCPEIVLLY